MKLGLKRGEPWYTLRGFFAALVRARCVSPYSHSAILIGDTVYQAAPFKGVYASPLVDNHGYEWLDIGGCDSRALQLFNKAAGASYDWFSLFAFILPWRMTSRKHYYCHELCLTMMGGIVTGRVTIETLFKEALQWKI